MEVLSDIWKNTFNHPDNESVVKAMLFDKCGEYFIKETVYAGGSPLKAFWREMTTGKCETYHRLGMSTETI